VHDAKLQATPTAKNDLIIAAPLLRTVNWRSKRATRWKRREILPYRQLSTLPVNVFLIFGVMTL
jgi:hypothetical protein